METPAAPPSTRKERLNRLWPGRVAPPRADLWPGCGPGPPEPSYAGALARVGPEMSPLFICPCYAFAKSVLLFVKFLHLVLNLQNSISSKYKWN